MSAQCPDARRGRRELQDVLATEGVRGLYRGIHSTLFTLFAANFIYFYAFHILRLTASRSAAARRLGKRLGLSRAVFNLLLGTLAGGACRRPPPPAPRTPHPPLARA
jgi:adenine nucleotide transporter 17